MNADPLLVEYLERELDRIREMYDSISMTQTDRSIVNRNISDVAELIELIKT